MTTTNNLLFTEETKEETYDYITECNKLFILLEKMKVMEKKWVKMKTHFIKNKIIKNINEELEQIKIPKFVYILSSNGELKKINFLDTKSNLFCRKLLNYNRLYYVCKQMKMSNPFCNSLNGIPVINTDITLEYLITAVKFENLLFTKF